MRYNALMAIAAVQLVKAKPSSGVASEPTVKPKPIETAHPAMPEGGWPETRQQRRARERNATSHD